MFVANILNYRRNRVIPSMNVSVESVRKGECGLFDAPCGFIIRLKQLLLQKRVQVLQAAPRSRPHLKYRSTGQVIREIGESIALVAIIYTLVNLASARFVVEGQSMFPNFNSDQFIIVSRINYLLSEPKRGEIVVFEYPNDTTQDYIKRVIGVPGDVIEIHDTQVYVNGSALNEPYINEPCTPQACVNRTWTLDKDQFFVMGDNRNHSSDSRVFGPVPRDLLIGEALVRYWPPQDWGLIHGYTN